MSAIESQIAAAKAAKKIVKTITEKVPEDIRGNVINLVIVELKGEMAQLSDKPIVAPAAAPVPAAGSDVLS